MCFQKILPVFSCLESHSRLSSCSIAWPHLAPWKQFYAGWDAPCYFCWKKGLAGGFNEFLKPFKISLTDFHGESVAGIDWIVQMALYIELRVYFSYVLRISVFKSGSNLWFKHQPGQGRFFSSYSCAWFCCLSLDQLFVIVLRNFKISETQFVLEYKRCVTSGYFW